MRNKYIRFTLLAVLSFGCLCSCSCSHTHDEKIIEKESNSSRFDIKKYYKNNLYIVGRRVFDEHYYTSCTSIWNSESFTLEEFPDLAVEKRSAVSIGRRLQDPLSELVKIPPSGIGVGLYQHDVSESKLSSSLDFVVEKCVNSVGVNVNTASTSLLSYVSGLTKSAIQKIISKSNNISYICHKITSYKGVIRSQSH